MPTSAPAPCAASAMPAVRHHEPDEWPAGHTTNLMSGRLATLLARDVHCCGIEVDCVPGEFTYLGSPEAVAVGDQDHGRVPVAVAITFGGLDQLLDLGLG